VVSFEFNLNSDLNSTREGSYEINSEGQSSTSELIVMHLVQYYAIKKRGYHVFSLICLKFLYISTPELSLIGQALVQVKEINSKFNSNPNPPNTTSFFQISADRHEVIITSGDIGNF
jgi:hypothetical protein